MMTQHLHSNHLSVNDASICLNIEQQACSNFGITVLMKRSFKIASRVGFNEATTDFVNNSVSIWKYILKFNTHIQYLFYSLILINGRIKSN